MQQHRVLPSLLLGSLALAASACTATSIESAAATDRPTAVEPVSKAVPTDPTDPSAPTDPAEPVVVTAPMPPTTTSRSPETTIAETTIAETTIAETRIADTTAPVTTVAVPPERAPAITVSPVLAASACNPVGPIPASAAAISEIALDVDADGSADDIATGYLNGDTGEWTLRLATSTGVVSELVVGGVGPGFVEALGAVELGQDGADSFLATIGSSASGFRIGLFGADGAGCLIRRGGDDLEFSVGQTIGSVSGIRCGTWDGDHFLESLGGSEVAPGAYNVFGTTWHLEADGELFAENGSHLFDLSVDDVSPLATIDCDGIDL